MVTALHQPALAIVTIVRSDGVRLAISEAEALALGAALTGLRSRPSYRGSRLRADRTAVFPLTARS